MFTLCTLILFACLQTRLVYNYNFNNISNAAYPFTTVKSSFQEKNSDLFSGKTLKLIFKITDRATQEIAGGTLKLENGTSVYLDGSGVPLAWDLRDKLNLTLDIHFSNDWSKIWDMVANGIVDLAVPLLTTELHFGYLDARNRIIVLPPVLSMSSDVFFRQPPLGGMSIIIFGLLTSETWLLLTSTWLLCTFGCYTISNIESNPSKQSTSYTDVLVWAVAVIYGKDYPVNSGVRNATRTSLRIAMLSAMYLSVVTLVIYTAKIVAFISVKTDHIKGAMDLLTYGYTLSSWSPVHTSRIFKDSKHRDKLIETAQTNFISGEDSLTKLADPIYSKSLYAFLTQSDGFHIYGQYYHNQYSHELCGISTIASSVKSPRAMYMRKGSEFREVVNWALIQLVERGMNHRHQSSYKRKYEFSCITPEQQFEQLSLRHTLLIFLILAVGALIAVLTEIVVLLSRLCNSR